MSRKIVIPLFIACSLFFNANLLAFANNSSFSNEIRLQEPQKIGFNVNYNSLNTDSQIISAATEIGSDVLWGAGIGAVLGLVWGGMADAGSRSGDWKLGIIVGPIFGLGLGAISGAIWGAGKVSGTQVEKTNNKVEKL